MSRVLVELTIEAEGKDDRKVMCYFSRVPSIDDCVSLSPDDGPYQVYSVLHFADAIESRELDDIKAVVTAKE